MAIIELIQAYSHISIILFSLAITLFITIVNFFVLDKKRMRELKERQKEIQKEIKEHQKAGNTEKIMELQKEMFSQMGETFKHSFKPMLITFLPIIIFFGFIRNIYTATEIAKTWFWWYIGASIISSLVFRKLFRLP